MHKKLLLIIITLCAFTNANAQDWLRGILALNSGEHIIGVIKYDYEAYYVQIRSENKLFAFSPDEFYTFKLLQNQQSLARNFYVLKDPENVEKLLFYESLYTGQVSLLVRRLKRDEANNITVNPMNKAADRTGANYPRPFINEIGAVETDYKPMNAHFPSNTTNAVDTYYMVNSEGEIKVLNGKVKDRIKAFGAFEKELSDYVKARNLKILKEEDLLQLVIYYNVVLAPNQSQ